MGGIWTRETGRSKRLGARKLRMRRHYHRRKNLSSRMRSLCKPRMNFQSMSRRLKRQRAPIDDACWFSARTKGIAKDCYEVYIDDEGLNYDASSNLSNIDGNNNKFYYVQLLCLTDTDKFKCAVWTHWGRVGEAGQNKLAVNMSLEAALVLFKAEFKDKTGLKWENRGDVPVANKYTMIEKNLMAMRRRMKQRVKLKGPTGLLRKSRRLTVRSVRNYKSSCAFFSIRAT